ncbi:transcriptional repressor NrdR [Candidatus Woesearchaeota archaeon]|nr:MAG: transcriptional repressor NrdR [Candidatus Woesearchaeota archaeon]
MKCPFCSSTELKVIDSRDTEDLSAIRRRRECEKCGKRFTTYERMENVAITVVKKDGTKEIFDRDKIRNGIIIACRKRDVSADDIEKAVNCIEQQVRNEENNIITSKKIGQLVMKQLRKMDKVAYIRFASVYKDFEDIETFAKEISKLSTK